MSEELARQSSKRLSSAEARRPSIREEQKLRTRERLLDAAFEVFREVGFRAATIDQIMDRAGANRATFYLHFNDKIAIAAALGRRSASVVAQRFRLLDGLVAPTRADIRAWLEEDMAERRQYAVLINVIQEALTTDSDFGQEYIAFYGRVASRVMVNTVQRWPEQDRPLIRSKIVCLLTMLHRIEFHVICQGVVMESDPLDAMADVLWNELFRGSATASL